MGVGAITVQERELSLLGGFRLRVDGHTLQTTNIDERLVAYLALRNRAVSRNCVAAALWASNDEMKASASLRTALWRARRLGVGLIEAVNDRLSLHASVMVDVARARAAAARLVDVQAAPPAPESIGLLALDLLPDWHDEWLTADRERHRQLRLHALELAAAACSRTGCFTIAVEAAELAVAADPLRESAHRSLIGVHISEGNWSEALRAYRCCCRILSDELGIGPSPALAALVAPVAISSDWAP